MRAAAFALLLSAVAAVGAYHQHNSLRGHKGELLLAHAPHLRLMAWHPHKLQGQNANSSEAWLCDSWPLQLNLTTLAETCPPLSDILDYDFVNSTTSQQDYLQYAYCNSARYCVKEATDMSSAWRESCAAEKRQRSKKGPSSKFESDEVFASLVMQETIIELGCSRSSTGTYCARLAADLFLKEGAECKFYTSCCLGELFKTMEDPPQEGLEKIEKACPGSTRFVNSSCTNRHM